ncbi:hypothetical protein CO172_03925 [Candidatus Uhrbacteria bacterium CG_4_9_14_3_um_filter_36_7]|uniref:Transcription regulator TrmB N-terminal domain-containing protein n=1 Tax=Candidatus Uhrbacteria bacterium CG_4_9_14_3_um_filter_36_7 TaxID=1975033 RepID=A0A2M7XEJ0_9BACT|nr:MAG: hypothetical protein CO172_03925 [Candidatus Uhrbacteria bacterium CG_4_9_14_3_um_filter_36_7]
MKLEDFLSHIGFKKNERVIYLATLENSPTSAPELARKTGLPRTTINLILKHLVQRGFVSKTFFKKRVRFVAEPPQKLIEHLKSLVQNGQELLPELQAHYNENDCKPKILFYEGKHAVQKVYDDTFLERPEQILEWNTDEYFNFDRHQVNPHYIDKRTRLGIKTKRIAGSGSRWQTKHALYDESELSQTLIVPKELFWPDIGINIYGNKVAFLNYQENMSVIIESKAIAKTMRQIYELNWILANKKQIKN